MSVNKKRSLREAMSSSLRSERDSVEGRFEKAERLFRAGDGELPVAPVATESASMATVAPAERVIRDNYSMPQSDYGMISELRERLLRQGVSVTKSEVLRAGLHALDALSDHDLIRIVKSLEKLKPGRRAGAV